MPKEGDKDEGDTEPPAEDTDVEGDMELLEDPEEDSEETSSSSSSLG